ncbi:hypothetical protein JYU34_018519 [Plutella xylostella]|uniref:Uncharacterized protein n=1 Tax=Plutella xylostella TaxID=51655 RepID=A0ABQ7PXR1_PLUXY|nr:hypothetical protein JYU34_018519 [Plutella xylostella]
MERGGPQPRKRVARRRVLEPRLQGRHRRDLRRLIQGGREELPSTVDWDPQHPQCE